MNISCQRDLFDVRFEWIYQCDQMEARRICESIKGGSGERVCESGAARGVEPGSSSQRANLNLDKPRRLERARAQTPGPTQALQAAQGAARDTAESSADARFGGNQFTTAVIRVPSRPTRRQWAGTLGRQQPRSGAARSRIPSGENFCSMCALAAERAPSRICTRERAASAPTRMAATRMPRGTRRTRSKAAAGMRSV